MSNLAILGGTPVIDAPFEIYNRIGPAERQAVFDTLETGVLSGYIGAPGPDFNGGPKVRELEERWSDAFEVRHSVAVNSATSGLFAAMGACGVSPGDEVIVPPYTMSATAMAPLVYGATPVFVDIEPETFCLDVELVRAAITDRTRAVIAVNLFGHPAQLAELRILADARGLRLIEDNAQAPLASEHGAFAGTIGHLGVFSLNRHKHIQTGEGGLCTTDDDDLALRLKLIRNHGENLVDHYGIDDIAGLVGFNYRLSELAAAVGLAQLDRAPEIIAEREGFGVRLSKGLAGLDGLTPPTAREGCRHVFYAWPLRFDPDVVGISRSVFVRAMAAEGVPLNEGYIEPLYLLPLFQRRTAIARNGAPFNTDNRTYAPGLCPVTERMYNIEEIGFGICAFELSNQIIDRIIEAFHKVYDARDHLYGLQDAS